MALLAPTAAAIAAGDTTEETWAGAGGFVVNIVDSGGHGRRLRRPQVSCSCFRARLRANLTNFTLFDASGTNGDTIEEAWAGAGGSVVNIVDSGGHGKRLRRPQVSCSCFRARFEG